jgi:acyl-coenzyme A thioesterase PaaI-like protein
MTDPNDEILPLPGYIPSRTRGPYSTRNGPYFHKTDGARFWHAVFLSDNHCNAHGRLHGGMAASFADGLLSTAISRTSRMRAVTIKMDISYMGAGGPGEWLEGTAEQTGSEDGIAYARAEAWIGTQTIFTAAGVFRLLGPRDQTFDNKETPRP